MPPAPAPGGRVISVPAPSGRVRKAELDLGVLPAVLALAAAITIVWTLRSRRARPRLP